MTVEDKNKWQKEGRCYRCNEKGHISCNCPQKPTHVAKASTSTPNDAVVATATITSNKALSADQKAEIYLTQLYNESDKVHA